MSNILKSVPVLAAGIVLSLGSCSQAHAIQGSLSAVANQGALVSKTTTGSAHLASSRADRDSAKKGGDSVELDRMKANLDDAVKEHGADSWTAFVKGRYLLQWYIDHNQLESAIPLCESLVEYCRESAGTTVSASSKQDHNNLILCLTVLSRLNDRLGRADKSANLLDDARSTYKDYQQRNYESRAQSFEQFIEINSVPNAVTQSKLSSLLNWRELR